MNNGFSWDRITHVLLDMDGTLIDRDFDDTFWLETVPREIARRDGISFEAAQEKLIAIYRSQEGTLNWFDVDYWAQVFDLDIVTLKEREAHRIRCLPGAERFCGYAHGLGKSLHLLTDAHPRALAIKLRQAPLGQYFDSIISAFNVGCIKQQRCFWDIAREMIGFDPASTVFIDDRPHVLESARRSGLQYVFHKAGSSAANPPEYHDGYFAVVDFSEIMEP